MHEYHIQYPVYQLASYIYIERESLLYKCTYKYMTVMYTQEYNTRVHCVSAETRSLYVLQLTEGQHAELKLVREHVRSCFDNLFGFMMPHPGLVIATGGSEDGKLAG